MARGSGASQVGSDSISPPISPAPSVGGESVATIVSSVSTTDYDPSIIYPRAPANTPATRSLAGDADSHVSFEYPGAPFNTPATQSLVGDVTELSQKQASDTHTLVESSLDKSVADAGEGKAHLRSRLRSDVPLLQQLFKPPVKAGTVKRKMTRQEILTKKARAGDPYHHATTTAAHSAPASEHFHEHDTWISLAEEDIARGLERLARAAKDLHKIDESVSVEQYYSEHLAKVLKAAEIDFDAHYLQ